MSLPPHLDPARPRRPSKLWALTKLIGSIAVAGALLAGLLLPYVGGVGIVARNSADVVEGLPDSFTIEDPESVTTILAVDGTVLTHLYTTYRVPVGLDQMAPVMRQAIVAIEDSRFYSHHGVDTTGTVRALLANVAAGTVEEGGSTLTQQLVKNTLLYQATSEEAQADATEDTVGRKLREMKLALEVERTYSKKQILEKYLNLVNFGGGAFGVQAAASLYFGVAAKDLTLPQAAMIAGIVKNPTAYNPLQNPDAALERRNLVLDAMATQGKITVADRNAAKATPLGLVPGGKPIRNCAAATNYGGFFCDYLVSYLTETAGIPEAELYGGGLTIQTTIDPATQVAATDAIVNQADFPMGGGKAAVLDIVEPGTGKVRALAVNRVFGNDPNDPAQTTVNLTTKASAGSGSTYKVFTAAAALAAGKTKDFTLHAPNGYESQIEKEKGGKYVVHNAGDYPEVMTLEDALYMSSNTYFVALEDALGSVTSPVQNAEAMGLWAAGDPLPQQIIDEQRASFTLGAEPTSPLRLAIAYATIAADGTACEPLPVEAVLGPDGQPLVNPETNTAYVSGTPTCRVGAIAPSVAKTLQQILLKDVMPGNAAQTAARAYLGDGREIAGKTGTAQNNYSYAFVGFTPQLVGAVLAYNPTTQETMPNVGGGEGGFGGGYPAQIWHDAMQVIMANLPKESFSAS